MNIWTTYSEDFKSDLILSDVLIFFDYQYRSIDMIRRFDNNQQLIIIISELVHVFVIYRNPLVYVFTVFNRTILI